jgi:hypothetical protein
MFIDVVTLYGVVGVDRFAQLQDFGIRKVLHAAGMIDSQLVGNLHRSGAANAMDIGERNYNALICWKINSGNTCQFLAPCSTGWPQAAPSQR